MSIWHAKPDPEQLRAFRENTLIAQLGIDGFEVGDDHLAATMPVDGRTRQPFGLLHGGASVALAETLASVGAHMTVDPDQTAAVGLEINANHLRAVRDGTVTGTGRPIHLGRRTQVWQVEIVDEEQKRVCISRVTMQLIPKRD